MQMPFNKYGRTLKESYRKKRTKKSPPLSTKRATGLDADMEEIKRLAESDLLAFIKLVAPHRVVGHIHEELIHWWTRPSAMTHQMVLLPRDHGKSAYIAY